MVNWFRVFKGKMYSNAIDRNLRENVRLAEKLGELSTKCTDKELTMISDNEQEKEQWLPCDCSK